MTPETERYLTEKLGHIEKLLGAEAENARCEVELGRDAGRPQHGDHLWFAEITLMPIGGATARATNRAENINTAIDDVQKEIERQLRKDKTNRSIGMRHLGARIKEWMKFGQEE